MTASMEAEWKCFCGSHIGYQGWWNGGAICRICKAEWVVTKEGAKLLTEKPKFETVMSNRLDLYDAVVSFDRATLSDMGDIRTSHFEQGY